MSRLSPVLNSIIGPNPANSAHDVQEALRAEVSCALTETDQRIAELGREIEDKVKARTQLLAHRDSLQAWIDNDGTSLISDQRYCEAEPRTLPGVKPSLSSEDQ